MTAPLFSYPKRWFVGLTLSCALLFTGCGGGSGGENTGKPAGGSIQDATTAPSSGSDDGGDAGAYLTMDFDVSGATSLKASTTYGPLSFDAGLTNATCAEYAKGGDQDGVRFWSLPALIGGDKVGGKDVLVIAGVWKYPGPGTFTDTETMQVSVDRMSLNIDKTVYELPYDDAAAEIVVKPDGSGTWTFPKLIDSDENAIAGTVSWTCKD